MDGKAHRDEYMMSEAHIFATPYSGPPAIGTGVVLGSGVTFLETALRDNSLRHSRLTFLFLR